VKESPSPTIIIAEAGINHNGSMDTAKKLIVSAYRAGADYVKFQTYIPEKLYIKSSPGYEECKKWHLSFDQQAELKKYCDKTGIKFLSTPFDEESVDFLCELGVDYLKIPSGEITNLPLIEHIARKKKPVILSTGMATFDETSDAVGVLGKLVIMHCVSLYPAPYKTLHLRYMRTLQEAFDCPVGFSDHSIGSRAAIAAVAMGASMIEKHVTLDRTMDGPDHAASMDIYEFRKLVKRIREVEKVLGREWKDIGHAELNMRDNARKSIVTGRPIEKGERFALDNLTTKRPGTGISPMEINDVIGKVATRHIPADTILTWLMVA
jgi:N,N'-diacetyllegionaminate synthase